MKLGMDRKTKQITVSLLAVVLVTRLALAVAGNIARNTFLDTSKPFPSWTYTGAKFLNVFTSWDSGFYYDIAVKGYPKVKNNAPTAELTVPAGTWLKVFLGGGFIGEEKTALPAPLFGGKVNNTVFLIGSDYKDSTVPIHYAYEGIPYCIYKGPIDYDRDVKVMGDSLVNATACGTSACSQSYVTYYSASEKRVLYQEVFENGNVETSRYLSGIFRPGGFSNAPYEGLGCHKVDVGDLKYYPDPNYEKVVTPYPYMPLYSYLARALGYIAGDVVLAGMVISIFMFLVSAVFLYKLLLNYFDEQVSFWATVAYIVYPFSFGATAFLAGGLYNALLLSSLYFAKKGKAFISIILLVFLVLTGISGIFALLPMYFMFQQVFAKHKAGWVFAGAISTSALTVLIHLANLKALSGSWLVFLKARNAWFVGAHNVFEAAINYFKYMDKYALFEAFIYVVVASVCIYFVYYLKTRKSYELAPEVLAFLGYSLVAPFLNGGLTAYPRFSASNFVLFAAVGYLVVNRPRVRTVVLVVSFVLSVVFFSLWSISSRFVV